MRMPKDSVN